ncbi:NADH-dependent flavin oxidoreductase iccG [Pseudocercospora fuligena]|uniref:NADH-dependent flavin oxidoreductase iccG n=1 Tax=Pseudocercospora fuligena TaxID=685502 RepID=A0A8H6RJ60_9PEZI|nr:NADH-dependent flavin oxidoreductase iccG [Pseudocercospora fuligena]
MASKAFEHFHLPNGSELKNRIIKAAMEENMADVVRGNQPSEALIRLYHEWAKGGSSLVLSGHIMIDPRALACPGDVLLAKDSPYHDDDIWRSRFRWTATKAEQLGINGVEIHAAHDQWGGSLENRARLLFEVIKAIRGAVSPSFGVGVKINCADFQRGGFDTQDLKWVVQQLNEMQLDFIELSGGNAESPAMRGAHQRIHDQRTARTVAREAYFLEAARDLEMVAKVPLIVTGGITTLETANAVAATSPRVLVGMATAVGIIPDLPNRWLAGESPVLQLPKSWLLPGILRFAASTACVQWNLHSIGLGKDTWPGVWLGIAFI